MRSIKDIAEQLTSGGGGRKLWVGILHAVKPKCHPLLLDSRINQPEGVALNVYQVFTLCAIKFYCQVKAMPRGADKNPAFFLGTSPAQAVGLECTTTNALVCAQA
jgi:hypothetical protein